LTIVHALKLSLLVCAWTISGCATVKAKGFCSSALDATRTQLEGFRDAYQDPALIPRSWSDGQVRLVGPGDWTSGFVAGSYWHMFEYTRELTWLASARARTFVLEDQKDRTDTHDVGFVIAGSFGNALRLAPTEEYESVVIQAAESLMTRFNETVGAIRSWDFGAWTFPVIIDNMMNIELLYIASELSGDQKYADVATRHALTTLENHFRPDHSSYHVVDFDPQRGTAINKQTHQGIADDSAWSRGQAWGLYGFTMTYRFTRDPRFLELATSIAEFYLNHPHLPDDKVPYFDFDVPGRPEIENFRDSSAAAIAASALLELASFVSRAEATRYRDAALAMLSSLTSPEYSAATGRNGHFLLMHATGRWQADDEIDSSINYADYYYLEALLRCSRLDD